MQDTDALDSLSNELWHHVCIRCCPLVKLPRALALARVFIRGNPAGLILFHILGRGLGECPEDIWQFLETFVLSLLGVAADMWDRSQECCRRAALHRVAPTSSVASDVRRTKAEKPSSRLLTDLRTNLEKSKLICRWPKNASRLSYVYKAYMSIRSLFPPKLSVSLPVLLSAYIPFPDLWLLALF